MRTEVEKVIDFYLSSFSGYNVNFLSLSFKVKKAWSLYLLNQTWVVLIFSIRSSSAMRINQTYLLISFIDSVARAENFDIVVETSWEITQLQKQI